MNAPQCDLSLLISTHMGMVIVRFCGHLVQQYSIGLVLLILLGCELHVLQEMCNLEREYRDCIKSRRDKIGITRHIIMHQVLYNYIALGAL